MHGRSALRSGDVAQPANRIGLLSPARGTWGQIELTVYLWGEARGIFSPTGQGAHILGRSPLDYAPSTWRSGTAVSSCT